jgi:hypothetical protein
MTLHENEHITITVHTWTTIFLEHLANMSFMASFQAWTESLSGLSLWACILLPRPTQYPAVYYSRVGFHTYHLPAIWVASHLCTSKHHNTVTRHMYTHVYTSHRHYYSSLLLHIFHSSWQAGWPRPFPSDTIISLTLLRLIMIHKTLLCINLITDKLCPSLSTTGKY